MYTFNASSGKLMNGACMAFVYDHSFLQVHVCIRQRDGKREPEQESIIECDFLCITMVSGVENYPSPRMSGCL